MTTSSLNNLKYFPRHVAIIADGNRTRAKKQGLSAMDGHFAGAQNTIELTKYIFTHTPINVLTGWFLSTENLRERSPEEVHFIFSIYKIIGNDLDEFLQEHHINFRWVGDPSGLTPDFLEFLENKQKNFSFPNSPKTVVFAINYGGRDEIIRAVKSLSPEEIATLTEESFSNKLDFGQIEPLEMVIRTKGDVAHRTSGFMTRWIGYAELYFATEFYPDFQAEQINKALIRYDSIAEGRNFGK